MPDPAEPSEEGAEERLDPFAQLSPYSLDHLARYALAATLAPRKRVLDAACGTGFGSLLLARAGARRVDAVDRDPAALARARETYPHASIRLAEADLDTFQGMPLGPWDLICSFETLEHVPEPEKLLDFFRARLAPHGLLLVSVPGEADRERSNPYHLHHFSRTSFQAILQERFDRVELLPQHLSVGAAFGAGAAATAAAISLPLAEDSPPPEGYLAIAGGKIPPALLEPSLWHAPAIWQHLDEERRRLYARIGELSREHGVLFREHSDLKEKFSVVLAWGKYYHHLAEKQDPPEDFLQSLQAETFARAERLNTDLQEARREIERLQAALSDARERLPAGAIARRRDRILAYLKTWRRDHPRRG